MSRFAIRFAASSLIVLLSVLWSVTASADDIEGRIESIDFSAQTFVVQGITFHATPGTDYDDGLKRFADLRVGQKVEVDFVFHEGRHIATEIELDD